MFFSNSVQLYAVLLEWLSKRSTSLCWWDSWEGLQVRLKHSFTLEFVSDAQLKEYSEKYEWSQDEKNPEVYFIANHEEKIRSRNIDEKLQFSDMIAVLRSIPKPLVPKSGKD